MRHPRQVLTRATIFDRVWGYDFGPASNSLEVYIGYLRRKTEAMGEPRLVHTVRGVGYVLKVVAGMSFRRRMILLAAGAVAAAIVLASAVVYVVTRGELLGQVDSSLRQKLIPGQAAVGPDTSHEHEPGPNEEARTRRQVAADGVPAGRIWRSLRTPLTAAADRGASGEASLQHDTSAHGETSVRTESVSIGANGFSGQSGSRQSGSSQAGGKSTGTELSGLAKLVLPPQKLGGATGYVQLIQSNGHIIRSEDIGTLTPRYRRRTRSRRRQAPSVLQRCDRRRHARARAHRARTRRRLCGRSRCRSATWTARSRT